MHLKQKDNNKLWLRATWERKASLAAWVPRAPNAIAWNEICPTVLNCECKRYEITFLKSSPNEWRQGIPFNKFSIKRILMKAGNINLIFFGKRFNADLCFIRCFILQLALMLNVTFFLSEAHPPGVYEKCVAFESNFNVGFQMKIIFMGLFEWALYRTHCPLKFSDGEFFKTRIILNYHYTFLYTIHFDMSTISLYHTKFIVLIIWQKRSVWYNIFTTLRKKW